MVTDLSAGTLSTRTGLQIRCYDHDIVGPPDLIGSIRLGTNAILGLVTTTTATAAATDDMRHAEAIRDRAVLRTASNVATTWLELRPVNNNNSHDRNTHTLALASTMQAPPSSIIADIKTRRSEGWGTSERNPFDSCGDIAVALRARLPLPACLQEYERLGEETKGDGNNQPSRLVADAGVRVSGWWRLARCIRSEAALIQVENSERRRASIDEFVKAWRFSTTGTRERNFVLH